MGENGMSKYVISTVEVTKRVYLLEAYSQSEALDKNIERGPESADEVEVLGEMTYSIEAINEYEYNKDWKPGLADKIDWKPEPKQKDWVGNRDRLKGPALNEIW